jgi:presenilin-like A22 family membrane protease
MQVAAVECQRVPCVWVLCVQVLAASAVKQLQIAMLPAAEACLMSCETCVGLWPVGLPMSFPTLALAVTSVVGTAAAVIVAVVILAAVIVVDAIAVAATATCFEQCPRERLLATVFWAQPCCLCVCFTRLELTNYTNALE